MFDEQSLRRISRAVQKVERQSFNTMPRQKNWPTVAAASQAGRRTIVHGVRFTGTVGNYQLALLPNSDGFELDASGQPLAISDNRLWQISGSVSLVVTRTSGTLNSGSLAIENAASQTLAFQNYIRVESSRFCGTLSFAFSSRIEPLGLEIKASTGVAFGPSANQTIFEASGFLAFLEPSGGGGTVTP